MFEDGRKVTSIALRDDRDVARARRKVSDIMTDMGARASMQTRFVTAVSEIARNAVVHGAGGDMDIYRFPGDRQVGVLVRDSGPGIADVEQAKVDGFSTGQNSLGRGLGGAFRLAHQMEIETVVGKGTAVRMIGRTQLR